MGVSFRTQLTAFGHALQREAVLRSPSCMPVVNEEAGKSVASLMARVSCFGVSTAAVGQKERSGIGGEDAA